MLALQLGDAINALVRRAEVVVGKFRFVAARFVSPAGLPIVQVHVDLIALCNRAPVGAKVPHPSDGLLGVFICLFLILGQVYEAEERHLGHLGHLAGGSASFGIQAHQSQRVFHWSEIGG